MKYILNKKLKYYTKKGTELLTMFIIGMAVITSLILIKYKPTYLVTVSGEKVGYIENKKTLEEEVKAEIIDTNEKQKNIDSLVYDEPEYELSLVNRQEESNVEEIAEQIKNNSEITYKYYEIELSNVPIDNVDTLEEAQNLVNQVKEEKKISINSASMEELVTLPGIGEKTAEKIIVYREVHGGFKALEELQNVAGIKSKIFAKIAPFIEL